MTAETSPPSSPPPPGVPGAPGIPGTPGSAGTSGDQPGAERPAAPRPGSEHFDTTHLKRDLKGRSLRGGAITVLASVAGFVISMGGTAVLARLLAPSDFGLMGMIMVVVGFIVLFKDMGLTMATVQQEHITHEQISTLFWINLLISVMVAGVTLASAPLIAWFYGEPQLLWMTMAGAPGQIISGLALQHQALLRRQMKFTTLAAIGLIGQLGALTVSITLAWRGYGVWALVAQPIANACFTLVSAWMLCSWRPGKMVRGSGVRPMLRFGGNLTGANFVNYIVRNCDNILLGKFAGADALGLYQKSYSILMLPIRQINGPITSVAVPGLSRLQSNPDAYRSYYRKAISLIVLFGMPIVCFSAVAAEKVILLLLGDQWGEAVIIFQALAPAAFIGTFNVATGWVYTSLGRTDRQFKLGIVTAIITLICFAVGVRWGALGMAIATSASFVILRYPSVWYCFHGTPLRMRDLESVLWRPTLTSIGAAAVVWALNRYAPIPLDALPEALRLVAGLALDGVVYALAYPALWVVLPGGRKVLLETIKLHREFRRKPAAAVEGKKKADE